MQKKEQQHKKSQTVSEKTMSLSYKQLCLKCEKAQQLHNTAAGESTDKEDDASESTQK